MTTSGPIQDWKYWYDQAVKKGAENFDLRKQLEAVTPLTEERKWGSFTVLADGVNSAGKQWKTKILDIKAGENISYQCHNHRAEQWLIVEGRGVLVLDGEFILVGAGEQFVIPEDMWHSMLASVDMKVVEVQYGNRCDEDDIHRLFLKWEDIVAEFGEEVDMYNAPEED